MASIRKIPSGKWQAQVARKGIRKSKSFNTKAEAVDWANRQEYLATESGGSNNITFGEMLDRYGRDFSSKKRGARWEIIRIEKLKGYPVADIRLSKLTASDFALWRDERLREVSPSSVAREMNLMSDALTKARRERGLISHNPLSDVKRPKAPPPRDRRVSQDEVDRLIEEAGLDLTTQVARSVHAFRFAIETGMRAGEIIGLTRDTVDFDRRVAHLPLTKNGSARDVPLSSVAVELLAELPEELDPLFGITSRNLDMLFRRVRDKAKIVDLRFHDSRHEAVTRMAKKLDVLDLARVIGHKDIRMLQVYYNPTVEELAARLDD